MLLRPQVQHSVLHHSRVTKLYARQLLIFTLFLMLVSGAVNYVIDPYGMNNTFSFTGINRIKPETETHERLFKASAIAERRPAIIALGTSRTDRGISMQHSAWGGTLGERYNAAIVGANMYEIWRYFEHANQGHRLKRVVLGVDLLAFNYYKENEPDFDEVLLSTEKNHTGLNALMRRMEIYFSLSTAISAKKTISGNCPHCYSPFLNDGQQNPQVSDEGLREGGGHYQVFLRNDKVAVSYLHFPPPTYRFSLIPPLSNKKSQFYFFERLLEIARRDNIDLRLFISPSHARQWDALHAAGLWPDFEQWKTKLVQILAEDSARHPDKSPIPLWDFSGYNTISMEPVPAPDDLTSSMTGYWESSHYKTEVGNMVLDKIFDHHEFNRTVPDDFGVLLTTENLTAHLLSTRLAGETYRSSHSQETAVIKHLAEKAMLERKRRLHRP